MIFYKNILRGGKNVHKYLDKEIHVTACGSLQKRVHVKKVIDYRKDAECAKSNQKKEKLGR